MSDDTKHTSGKLRDESIAQNSLQAMATHSRQLVEQAKLAIPETRMRSLALDALEAQLLGQCSDSARPFRHALAKPGLQPIYELGNAQVTARSNKVSFPSTQEAQGLQTTGAAAYACSIEPTWTLESIEHLGEITLKTSIPLLCKGFIVDSYQIYEAKAAGASAVLLICGILSNEELISFNALAENLGMSVLVEVHNENEVQRALSVGARIIGIGNEDPSNSSIDFEKLARLRKHIPSGYLCIMDSEVQSSKDLASLSNIGIDATFVSEMFLHTE